MIGTTNTGINRTILFEYWDICSEKVKDFDAEVSEIVKSGNAANFREKVIREDIVIKSPKRSESLLHHAVTCEGENKIEMISAVLQSSMENINHQDEDDNTPLMYLLYEAQKGKYTKEDLEKIIRFLVARGASFEMRNNEGTTADDLKTVLISEGILDDGIDKIIDEAKTSSSLPNRIKEQLSKHITNNGNPIIQEVAVYGNYAQIKLNSDDAELKISEFLQGDFCKDNGISGFSTFHNDDKGGMHGFLSPNGVRNYTVTDGSYDMTLDWVVGGKKCTITINISKDGVVVIDENGVIVEDKNGLTDEQLKANECVTINGLSLFDAINKGRNREQNIRQENMQGADEVDSNAPKVKEQIRVREAPLQRNVQQQKSTDEKGIPLKKLQYQQEETNPKVVGSYGDTGSGIPSAPKGTEQSDPQDTSPELTEQSDSRNTNPKSLGGYTESDSGYSSPTGNKGIGDQGTLQESESELKRRFAQLNMGLKSPGTSNSQTKQSDPQDTSSGEFAEYAQFYSKLMKEELRNRGGLQDTSPKLTEQSDSRNTDPKSLGGYTESDSGLGSSPTAYSNQSALDHKQLIRKLDGLCQGAGNEAAKLRLSKEVLSEVRSNLKIVKGQSAKKSEVKNPIDMMLSQIPKGRIRKFLESKKGSSAQVADDNGLGKMQGHSGTSKFENKLSQKELPTSQQSTGKDSSILNSSKEGSGLKPADRSKMSKNTKQYLDNKNNYIEPAHAEEVRTGPTDNHDKNRVRQANKLRDVLNLNQSNEQEGLHVSRIIKNNSQGKGGHGR